MILTGGLDLSVPWTIGFSGILLAGMVKGSDAALIYALPAALLVGLAVGFINGAGVVLPSGHVLVRGGSLTRARAPASSKAARDELV